MLNLRDRFAELTAWSERCESAVSLLDDIEANVLSITNDTSLILPNADKVFEAFRRTSYEDVKAVIIGQDPYFNKVEVGGVELSQAMGLSFSVPDGVRPPPSLKNIYKELAANFNYWQAPNHGDLRSWADEVLLLNTSLTVELGAAGSHAKAGWGNFTQQIIKELISREKPLVFLAWGRHAHKAVEAAENTHHCVIKTSHPSPLGATKKGKDFDAFLGSRCFSITNEFLMKNRIPLIDWEL